MRSQPYGWSRKNHIVNLEKSLFESGNSYAPIAVTSDSLDAFGQKSYKPQGWAGELNLSAHTWQISASGTSGDVYGKLRKNPAGGRINNIRIYRSKILIRRFMPEDALRFHRAWQELSYWDQAMLWTHYAPKIAHNRKVSLLQTTNDRYPDWLDLSQRTIARIIERFDAEFNSKKPKPKSTKARIKADSGPLWSCRIVASIHKFPIRHSNVKDILPVSFSPKGFRTPRSNADFLPTDDNNVFRRENGEIYAVISNRKYGQLYRQGKASSFLAERREIAMDFTYCHFDEWHPIKCRPMKISLNEATFRSNLAIEGIVMIGTRFIVWEKPVPHYNSPEWLKKRGLTKLDECAQQWGRELLESKPTWFGGGKNG